MSKIYTVAIEKGGVGKTTTALNLGAGFGDMGAPTLLVDLDSQSHLSRWLGYRNDGSGTIANLIMDHMSGVEVDFSRYIRMADFPNVDYIPSNQFLSGIDSILASGGLNNEVLSSIFREDFFTQYEYILFDCLDHSQESRQRKVQICERC